MDRHHDLEATHVGLQDLGDGDTAIGLPMVLEECDEHTRRSHAGVIPVSYTHLICRVSDPHLQVLYHKAYELDTICPTVLTEQAVFRSLAK